MTLGAVDRPRLRTSAGPGVEARSWARVGGLLGVLAALVVVSAAAAVPIYARTADPVVVATGETGPVTDTMMRLTDGLHDTEIVLVADEGSTGTVVVPVRNTGHVSLSLTGLAQDRLPDFAPASLSWTRSTAQAAQPFPAEVAPGETVLLQLTLTKPSCPAAVESREIQALPLRYDLLGAHRVVELPMRGGGGPLPLAVCFPRSALRHAR